MYRVSVLKAYSDVRLVAPAVGGFAGPVSTFGQTDPPGPDSSPLVPSWTALLPADVLAAWGPNSEWPGASSHHPGIVMCARADGSVSETNTNIYWPTWLMLNAIADRKVLGEPLDYPKLP